MTRPNEITHPEAKYKVRVVFHSFIAYVIARSEPVMSLHDTAHGPERRWDIDVIEDTAEGDTLGYVDWSCVETVTWRHV